ncbi:coat protein [Radish leaf curl virus-Hajipur [IN:LabIso:11]]|nr:coat protein [Radish leaf curl virus-Hajipur [IN:Bih:ok09]]ADZ45281.1 coat protein [Radish leaf curl virus-Hajipur [IN:Bih06:10]]AFI56229.1 coat protein [Radish leaf curl virus-Hajipur [IN:LabIso:11]]
MSKRPADIIISTPASKVRRVSTSTAHMCAVLLPPLSASPKQKHGRTDPWTESPGCTGCTEVQMFRRGCEGPCKVQSLSPDMIFSIYGKVMCVSDATRGTGLTHRVGKRFCVKSVYVLGKIWMDENIKTKNHTNSVMFFLVRDRRPVDKPQDFGEVFNMFDNEPSTATVKNVHRDRYQVLRKWYATVTGGQYASKEQALVKKFIRVNNYVVYNQQEAGKYENHSENALMLYMARTHASNPVYATLKIRIYFYDSVTN